MEVWGIFHLLLWLCIIHYSVFVWFVICNMSVSFLTNVIILMCRAEMCSPIAKVYLNMIFEVTPRGMKSRTTLHDVTPRDLASRTTPHDVIPRDMTSRTMRYESHHVTWCHELSDMTSQTTRHDFTNYATWRQTTWRDITNYATWRHHTEHDVRTRDKAYLGIRQHYIQELFIFNHSLSWLD